MSLSLARDRRVEPLVGLFVSARGAALLSAGLAAAALAGAHLSEWLFNFPPCALCLKQREIIWAALAVSVAAMAAPRSLRGPLLVGAACLWGADAMLAAAHAGAEWGFYAPPESCGVTATTMPEVSLDSLQAQGPVQSCGEAPFRFLGLSFAGWNAVIGAVAGLFCLSRRQAR
jgi:disulfide bond formation protein DsbB